MNNVLTITCIQRVKGKVSAINILIDFQENFESCGESSATGEILITQDIDIWEDKHALQREKDSFIEQKSNFEQERINFTNAAIRLTKEVYVGRSIIKKNKLRINGIKKNCQELFM